MSNSMSLKALYKEQYDLYPKLSQEEIVALYENEGIEICDAQQKLEELEKALLKKVFPDIVANGDAEISILRNMLNGEGLDDPEDEKIKEIQKELEELDEQRKQLKGFKSYFHKFYVSTSGVKPGFRKMPSFELRNEIVCGTIGLARYWASVYFRKTDNTIPFDDLFQVASGALMSAAHYYAPGGNAKFSTYASRCIENKLKREVYNKRRMKKRPYKPQDFFQREKDNLKYLQNFLLALKKTTSSGRKIYSDKYDQNTFTLLLRFKRLIMSHNREMRLREEMDRSFSSFTKIREQETLNNITQRIIRMINDSKMKTLITNEDRELASLLVNFQNISKSRQETHELIYYLEIYEEKLGLIEQYLQMESQLTNENDGIVPTDEEILVALNKKISKDNKEKNRLKKEGFLEEAPSYIPYHNYKVEYEILYDVDPLIPPEEYENGYNSSKKKERDDIAASMEEQMENLRWLYDEIEQCESETVVLYFDYEDDLCPNYNWQEFNPDREYLTGDILSKNEALKKITEMMDFLTNIPEEDYVQIFLEQRKEKVNAILKEKNAPIIEQNREIKKQADLYDWGLTRQKRLKPNQIANTKRDIELLFGDDSELLILMNANRSKGKWYRNSSASIEDTALESVFFDDYYAALEQLSENEKQVLLMYFDKNGIHSMKAKEIGLQLSMTENQVYKTKAKALKKLRQNPVLQGYNEV